MGGFIRQTGRFLSGASSKPPPVIVNAPPSQQIANKMPPVNFARVMDTLTGDKLDIIRGLDGALSLSFGNGERISLDRPVDVGNVNTNLPAVRPIRGRSIDERAVEVIALSQAMSRLGTVIEQTERMNPYLIEQNQDLINSYNNAVTTALDRGFDFKQQAIDQKLTKMGLANSSTALGVQVALAREKASTYAQAELSKAQLAQDLKQQAIANLHQRSGQIAQNAEIELNRFNNETSNQLQVRGQDMQADLSTQTLEQQQAAAQVALNLEANQQRLNTEFGNKQLLEQKRDRMVTAGTNLFNQGNDQALNARSIENQSIVNSNAAQFGRYNMMPENPWRTAGRNFLVNSVFGPTASSSGAKGETEISGMPWRKGGN